MGFLDPGTDSDIKAPEEKPKTGGFLSDNPPPPEVQTEAPAPSWSQVPAKALVNAPESAWNFAKNLVHPVMHPIDTMEGIGSTALGLMEKAGLYGHAGYEKNADAVGKMVMDRYGSVDNLKKTLASDPVGVAGDLSTVLTGGGSLAARAPGILGKVGEAANVAGRVVDPLNAVTTPAKLGAGLATHTSGTLTGAGGRSFEEAAKAGFEGGDAAKVFRDNMRGNVPLESVVQDARSALDNMRRERGADYKTGMSGVAINQTPVPLTAWRDIYNAVHDAESIKSFKGQELDPKTTAIRDQLRQDVSDWTRLPANDFHTAEGMDALKRKIGNTRDALEKGTPERAVADIYYNAVRKAIQTHVPEYGQIMEGYGKASDTLREIEKTLSLPRDERKVNVDTSLRKLQSVLRNNVNTNFGQREKMVEYLERNGSPHLMQALAGQTLNSWTPRGLNRLAAALGLEEAALHADRAGKIAMILPFMSPRMMGELYYGSGRAVSPLKYAKPILNKPVARIVQEVGRWTPPDQPQYARGGAVDRALRLTKRGS